MIVARQVRGKAMQVCELRSRFMHVRAMQATEARTAGICMHVRHLHLTGVRQGLFMACMVQYLWSAMPCEEVQQHSQGE